MVKKIAFTVLGCIGITFVVTGLNGFGLYLRWWGPEIFQQVAGDQLGSMVAYTGVGAFLIYISFKQLRKKAKKLYIELTKTNGDKPEYAGPFRDEPSLQIWYQENRDKLEGIEDAKIVRA